VHKYLLDTPPCGITVAEKNCRQGERREHSFWRENILDNICPNPNALASERELSTRRVFNGFERRYLSLEVRSMVCGLLDSKSIPHDLTENAVQQAVNLGSINGEGIDVRTFEALFHAVSLNPSFKVPFWFISTVAQNRTWIC